MYKEFTNKIIAYKLKDLTLAKNAQDILTAYLIGNDLMNEGRDMTVEGYTFAKGSAFYSVFVRNGFLNEWYEPVYETISLSKEFMLLYGFKTIKDDGIYGEAIDIKGNGMTVIYWNREGRNVSYFGEKLDSNIGIEIRKDGGTRCVFNGYIFNEDELNYILVRTW